MKLMEILGDTPVPVIMERTFYPESLNPDLSEKEIMDGMLFGYCSWDGKELKSLDGDNYSLDEDIERFEWDEDGSLTYWTRSEWTGG
jgi:hypothetical protein